MSVYEKVSVEVIVFNIIYVPLSIEVSLLIVYDLIDEPPLSLGVFQVIVTWFFTNFEVSWVIFVIYPGTEAIKTDISLLKINNVGSDIELYAPILKL